MPCQYIGNQETGNLGARRGKAIILKTMKTIDDIWALLAPEGEYKRRRGACERLWQGYEAGRQEAIYEKIAGKIARGEFVNQNPYFAIEDNARETRPRRQEMSYNDYYAKYGTTEEKDGWKMVNPTGNKVEYVKIG